MKNNFKLKKVLCLFLMVVIIFPLVFLTACDLPISDIVEFIDEGIDLSEFDEKEDPEPVMMFQIAYRPKSTKKPGLLEKTYGEQIKDNLYELSEHILTRIVGEYGIGDISVSTGWFSSITFTPRYNNVDYAELLAIDYNLSENQKKAFATDFSNLTDVYYESFSSKGYVLILSNYDADADDYITFDADEESYTAKTSLALINGSTMKTYNQDDEMDSGDVLFTSSSDKYAYIFIGGRTGGYGSNSYIGSSNAENYVLKLLGSNFNKIQHFVNNIRIYDGASASIDYERWEYSLTDSEMESVRSADNYLDKYVAKFKGPFTVELAKALLTKYEGCELTDELQSLYYSASGLNASSANQTKFIEGCCEYIGYLGLLKDDKDAILDFIMSEVIGIGQEGVDAFLDNCDENVVSKVMVDIPLKPIIEYAWFSDGFDSFEIDGCIQSISIFSLKAPSDFSGFCFTLEEEIDFNYFDLTFIVHNNEVNTHTPFSTDLGLSKEIQMDLTEVDPDSPSEIKIATTDKKLIKKYKSNTLSNDDIAGNYIFSKDSNNIDGACWFLEDENMNYVQITFGFRTLVDAISPKFEAGFFY